MRWSLPVACLLTLTALPESRLPPPSLLRRPRAASRAARGPGRPCRA